MFGKTIEKIESQEFSAIVNTASSELAFVEAVFSQKETSDLIELLKQPSYLRQVMQRIFSLSDEVGDPDYEHPHDAAIATYLLCLGEADNKVAKIGAAHIEKINNCWWAIKIAKAIQDQKSHESAIGKLRFPTSVVILILSLISISTIVCANQKDSPKPTELPISKVSEYQAPKKKFIAVELNLSPIETGSKLTNRMEMQIKLSGPLKSVRFVEVAIYNNADNAEADAYVIQDTQYLVILTPLNPKDSYKIIIYLDPENDMDKVLNLLEEARKDEKKFFKAIVKTIE